MGKSLADRIPNPGINTHLPRINKTSMQTRRGFQERRGSVPECASPLALSVRTRVAGPHDGIRWHLVPGRKRQRTAALQDRSESIQSNGPLVDVGCSPVDIGHSLCNTK